MRNNPPATMSGMLLPSYLQSSRNSAVWLHACFHWAVAFPARNTGKHGKKVKAWINYVICDRLKWLTYCVWYVSGSRRKFFPHCPVFGFHRDSQVLVIFLSNSCKKQNKQTNKQEPTLFFFIAILFLFFLLQKYPPRMMCTSYFYCDNT